MTLKGEVTAVEKVGSGWRVTVDFGAPGHLTLYLNPEDVRTALPMGKEVEVEMRL